MLQKGTEVVLSLQFVVICHLGEVVHCQLPYSKGVFGDGAGAAAQISRLEAGAPQEKVQAKALLQHGKIKSLVGGEQGIALVGEQAAEKAGRVHVGAGHEIAVKGSGTAAGRNAH